MRVTRVVVASVALCAMARVAVADVEASKPGTVGVRDNSMEVGLFVGAWFSNYYHAFSADEGPTEELEYFNPEVGLRLGYLPPKYGRYLGFEGELQYTLSQTKSGLDAPIYGVRAQVVGQYPELGLFAPFALLGGGIAHLSSSSAVMGSDTDGVLHAGIGAKLYATNSLIFRVEGRLLLGGSAKPGDDFGSTYGEVFLGFSYSAQIKQQQQEPPPNPDPDGDGFLGVLDACPEQVGIAPDGCPPKDSDQDGLLDNEDKCPNQAETVNGWQDEDGCPDEIPDTDGDGLNDLQDKCKDAAEDTDGFEDEDGCPDLDNDADGVVDTADNCPTEAGPPENRGCPDTDQDGDGVVDRLDNCPDEAGTEANHGCQKKQLVVLTTQQLKILDKVYFRTGRARIQTRSRPLLDNIAAVLASHPEIKKIRVEGHTDDQGADDKNKTLSQSRAEAVVEYLVKKGIDADRLEPVGFGEEKPIEDNTTRKGRAANRRVEFNIVNE